MRPRASVAGRTCSAPFSATIGAYFAVLIALGLVGMLILKGSVWLSEHITPWLFKISWCGLIVVLLGLLPLVASRETRGAGGLGLFFISYLFGATLWFWSMLITYTIWGWPALIIGLMIMGVGVLPIALLATGIKGEWALFGELLLLLVVTIGTRGGGTWAVHRHEEDPGDIDMPKNLVVTAWLPASIVTGGLKLDQLQEEPFLTLYSALTRDVYQADAILFGGYGFADPHINSVISSMLRSKASCGSRPPVLVLTRNLDGPPTAKRHDVWATSLGQTLRVTPVTFRGPNMMQQKQWAELPEKIDNGGFERSLAVPVAIWNGGFLTARDRTEAIVKWLVGDVTALGHS